MPEWASASGYILIVKRNNPYYAKYDFCTVSLFCILPCMCCILIQTKDFIGELNFTGYLLWSGFLFFCIMCTLFWKQREWTIWEIAGLYPGMKLQEEINLIPFRDGISLSMILNVVMFMPLGFYCPCFWRISKSGQNCDNRFLFFVWNWILSAFSTGGFGCGWSAHEYARRNFAILGWSGLFSRYHAFDMDGEIKFHGRKRGTPNCWLLSLSVSSFCIIGDGRFKEKDWQPAVFVKESLVISLYIIMFVKCRRSFHKSLNSRMWFVRAILIPDAPVLR